jgi:hypothetical protein
MSIDLAAVRAAAEQFISALQNPAGPAVRCEAARLKNEEDRLTTFVDQEGYRPVRAEELAESTVVQILGARLWGLLDLDAPGRRSNSPGRSANPCIG